jgi:hypothetical protein
MNCPYAESNDYGYSLDGSRDEGRPRDGYFFPLPFGAQGCLLIAPWHFLICFGVHSSGFPFNSSGHWHPDFFSAQHIIFSSFV